MNDTPGVTRVVKLKSGASLQHARDALRALDGVVSVDVKGQQQLHISYDFTRLTWAAVCETLKRAGDYTPNWLARWRDGWRDQLDYNMRDNLTHRAACCSKPPPGAGRH